MRFRHPIQHLLAASALALTACGGGGGVVAVSTTTVSGTAATGAAIASGSVSLKCVSGTTSVVTTGTDGSFLIDVSAVTLPCVGRVDYKDAVGVAQKLHTFVSAKGTANITPITELLVANLTGGTALAAFDSFDATKVKGLLPAQVTAAAAAVKAYLKNILGVDTTNLPDDPIGSKFVAKSGIVAGDSLDKVLDDIQAKLKTGGKTLGSLVADLGKPTGGGGGAGCTGDVLAFFTKNKGTYPVTVDIYTPGPQGAAATVAGFADKAATNVIVSESCTVTVGATVLAYKDGSYSPSPGGQIDVVLTGTGFSTATYEVFVAPAAGGLVNLGDSTTKAFANLFTK